MKKSGLRNLFDADDEPGDKSLLSYQQANHVQKGQPDKSLQRPRMQNSGFYPAQEYDGRTEGLERNSMGENTNKKHDFLSSSEGDVWPPTGNTLGASLSSSKEFHSSDISTSFLANGDSVSEDGDHPTFHHRKTTTPSSSTSSTKEPHATSSHSSGASVPAQLCFSTVVTAYMYGKTGELAALGTVGLAVTHEPARGRSLLVLYRSRKEQLCLATLVPSKLPEVKANNYVMVACDSGRRFSVRPADPEVLFELMLNVVRAARLAADQHNQTPAVVVRASLNTEPQGLVGNAITSNDRVDFRLARWKFDSKSNKPRKILAEKEITGATQEYDFLQAMRIGERQLVAVNADCGVEFWDVFILAVRPRPCEINLGGDSDWTRLRNSDSNRNDHHQAQLSDDGTQRGDNKEENSRADAGLENEASGVVLQSTDGEGASGAISEKYPGLGDNPQITSVSLDKPTPDGEDSGDALRRSHVLSRVARLGRHMFPLPEAARKQQESAPSYSSDTNSAASSTRQVSGTGDDRRSANGRCASPPRLQEASSSKDKDRCGSPTVHTHPSTKTGKCGPRTEEENDLAFRLDRLEAKLDVVLSRLDQAHTERTRSGSRSSPGSSVETRRHAESRDQAEDVLELRLASVAEACEAVLSSDVCEPAAQNTEDSPGLRRVDHVAGAEACDVPQSGMADSLMSGIQRLIREHSSLRHQVREAEELRLKAEQELELLNERCSEAKSRQAETEMKLSEAELRASTAEERLAEVEARALEAEREQVEVKERARELESVGIEAGERASEAEARLMKAHRSLGEMERKVSEYRSRMTAMETRLEPDPCSSASSSTVAPAAARRLLKTVYKQMCARLTDDGAYSADQVGELVQQVMRVTLEQLKDRDGGSVP